MCQTDTERSEALEQMGAKRSDVLVSLKISFSAFRMGLGIHKWPKLNHQSKYTQGNP